MKRCISLILSAVLLLSCIPAPNAMATEEPQIQIVPEDLLSLVQSSAETEETSPEETFPGEAAPTEATEATEATQEKTAAGPQTTRATSSNGFTYTLTDEGAVITGFSGSGENVVIPETIDGYPVVNVYLAYSSKIISITLPNSITSLTGSAFYQCNKLTTVILPDTLVEIGSSAFRYCTALTTIELPASLKRIYGSAFSDCTNLETVLIPQSIEWIHDYAFYNCNKLTYNNRYDQAYYLGDAENPYTVLMAVASTDITAVTIHPDTKVIFANAFSGCTGLTEVVIPDGVTCIGYGAFAGCSGLKSLVLPFVGNARYPVQDQSAYPMGYIFSKTNYTGATADGSGYYIPDSLRLVTVKGGEIGYKAFYNCKNLTQIVLGDGVTGIDRTAFLGCVGLTSIKLPNGVTHIGQEAFRGCTQLKEVQIDGNLTEIGYGAFRDCSALTDLQLMAGLTSIGDYAFYNCSSLTNLQLPDGLISIGASAFYNCSSLTNLQIPESVTYIGSNAFHNCGSLAYAVYGGCNYLGPLDNPYRVLVKTDGSNSTSYEIHPDNKVIAPGAFSGCSNLVEIVLAEGTTSIGASAFSGCSNLTSIEIPAGVTEIGASTFSRCSNLTSIEIPAGVTEIGAWTFSECNSLTSIEIPTGVTKIGESAFYGCSGLTSIEIPAGVTEIGNGAFTYCSNLESVTIGRGITKLGQMFIGCSSLKTLVIPDTVTTIEAGALKGLSKLESLTIPYVGYRDSYYGYAFGYFFGNESYSGATPVEQPIYREVHNAYSSDTYYIPNTLKSVTVLGGELKHSVFENITCIEELILGDGVTDIRYRALANCTGLTRLVVSDSLSYIDKEAFVLNENMQYNQYDNGLYWGNATQPYLVLVDTVSKSISSIEIHPQARIVLHNALQNCGALTQLVVPDSVVQIGYGAFSGCSSLKSITVPLAYSIDKYWGAYKDPFAHLFYASYDDEIGQTRYYLPSSLTQITVTGGEIIDYAFDGCGYVTSIVLGDRVTGMGDYAFNGCNRLTRVVIGDGVTSIGECAFYYCSQLSDVTIGSGVKEIKEEAFYYCDKLKTLVIPENVTTISERAIVNCGGLQSITLPFIGTSREQPWCLGVIFGRDSYTDTHSAYQAYGPFYIPSTLSKVVVTGGDVPEDAFNGWTGLYRVELPATTAKIGESAFEGCTNLRYLTIPGSVTDIGASAFSGCSKLSTVEIPEGVTHIPAETFYNCSGLSSITIPNSVSSIGYRAFYGCTALNYTTNGQGMYLGNSENPYLVLAGTATADTTSFTALEETRIILYSAFSKHTKLTSVVLHNGITDIGSDAFSDCTSLTRVVLPSNITQLSDYLFYRCSKLASVTIPDSVTSIGKSAFYQCTKLAAITLPGNLLTIGSSAFSGCTGLAGIDLPDGLVEIGNSAFASCTKLTNVRVPDSVQTIGSGAFGRCSKLTSITIPFVGASRKTASDTYQYPFGHLFGTSSFTGGTAVEQVYYGYDTTSLSKTTYYIPTSLKSVTVTGGEILHGAFRNCTMLTSITLPDGITSIGPVAFYCCTGLTSITLPETVQTIGTAAFRSCTKLKAITLPKNMETISDEMFYYCFALTNVVWPENLTSIGRKAFYDCEKLVINTWPQTLTSIGDYAFVDCTAMTELKLPEGLQTIGSYVFQGCTGLQKVEIPDTVTGIGSYVLSKCSNIRELTIPFIGASRKTASDKQQYPLGYLFGSTSYTGGVSTKQYYYGSSTTSTTYSTYYIPSSLKRVQVNGGQLLYGAFYNCANIQTIALGENVLVVNPDAFIGTNGLEAFEVDINNPNYCSYNRILYNKDKTEVIWNPTKHTFVLTINYMYADGTPAGQTIVKRLRTGDAYNAAIPEILGYSTIMTSVSGTMPFQDLVIDVVYYENPVVARGQCTDTLSWTMYKDGMLVFRGTGAMPDYQNGTAPWAAYAQQVKIVYLDPRVTSIGAYAFQNCSHLTYVDYGYSVDTVGAYAFAGCSALTSFSLPESVTEVAQGAFSGCTGLKAVVIPDNITAIGDEAFRGCTNLVQATIGGNVTEIGSNAFTDCPGLTQIYFRGEPATVGSEPFGSVVGKVVFYYSTVSGWDEQIDGNSEWHGYTAFPYNAISGEDVDLDSLYIIKVVDKHNNPLANAWITLGDQAGETDHNGLAHFGHKPTQPEYLKIECSNHRDFVDQEFTTTSTQLMDVIEMTDKPSYIQGIRMNQRSIVTSVEVLDSAKNEQVRITVGGYSKYKIIKYELCQGSRVIASYSPKNPTSGNGEYTFSVSANSFEEGQTVLVRMYTSDGQSVASSLNIDVVHLAVLSEAQIMDEFSNLSITIGLGGMGEYKVPFTVTGSGEEMVYVSVTGRTIRVGINLDLAEIFGKDEEKDTPIGLIHKMVDNAMKNNVTDKTGVIFDLCGYLELEYLGDGEYFIKTSYVKVSVGVKIGVRAQASFHGIVGVYFEASVSAKGTLELKISRVTPEEGFKFDELNFSPEVGMGIEGGAYILWGAGSAGIYGELTMGFTLGIIPEFDIKTVYVSGEIGVKWSLLWGVFGNKHVIASGDIYRWPSDYQPQEIALFLRRMQNDLDAYTVNDRSYLEERSDWQGSGEYLQTGIYDQVAPKTVTCGNTTMMLWLDDNAQRDVANFQTLYYSLYENGTWTQPIAVDDNGTFDCEFDVCTDGRKIYVLYTERATVASNVATMDVSDIESLMAFANGVEVMVSEYENGRFSTPRKLTNNNICETMPKISLSGGKITAAWLETNNVGMGEDSEINTLRTLYLNAETEEQTTTISEEKTIGSMTVVEMLGQNCTAYTVDADGSGETTDDQVLVLAIALGEQHHLDTGNITDVHAATIKGCDVLTWNKNGRVYMLADPNGSAVCLSPEGMVVGAYQILTAGNDTVLLFVNGGTVYSLFLDETGALTQPVRMVSEEGNISGFSATYENGTIRAVYTQTTAQIQNNTMHTVSNLRNVVLEFHTDITLNSIDYQILDAKAMTELMVTAQVINSGSNRVDYLEVNLIDPEGKTVYSAQHVVEMPSGNSAECRIPLVLPQTLVTGNYVLEILPCRGMTRLNDANLQDNSTKLTLAYTDLSVSAEQKIIGVKNYIALTVSNLGNTATHGKIEVFAPDRSGRLIADIQTEGAILPGQMQQYFVDIHALTSKADALVTCVVTAAYNDPVTLNDTDTVKLLHLQTDGFVADPGQAVVNPELEMTTGNFDKYHPQDLTVTIKTGAEEFSGIDGLIKGTDYIVNYKTGIVKVMASYLAGLQTGRNTLMFRFNYGNAASATRAYVLSVTDSTPIPLSGSVAIAGDPMVGLTVTADLSGLSHPEASVTYSWTVDGECVSTDRSYTILPSDKEQALELTVTGCDGYAGSLHVQTQVTLQEKNAPVAPVVSKVEADAITVIRMTGIQYSLDGQTWQSDNVFADLQPNTAYTVYARYAETETSYASEPSSTTVTTPKYARTISAPTQFTPVTGVMHFGGAIPSAAATDGQISYGYSMTDDPKTVSQWSEQGILPKENTPTEYYVFARITGGEKYDDAVSIGCLVQAHVHQYTETVVKPTISEQGYTLHTCTGCGDSYKDSFVDKLTYIVGDVNRDGRVNTQDRILLARYLAKWIGYDAEKIDLLAADVNGDGRVNTQDRIILARYLAKWIGYEKLPADN